MFEILANFVVRFRWIIILFWIVAIPVTYKYLPSLASVTNSSNSAYLPLTSPSQKAQKMAVPFEGKDTSISGTLVVYRPDGKLTASDGAEVSLLEKQIKSIPSVVSIQDQALSKDQQVRRINIGFNSTAYGTGGTDIVKSLRSMIVKYTGSSNLQIHFGGLLGNNVDSDSVTNASRNNTEIYTVIFIIIILLIVYRSLIAPFVTLLPAVFALIVASPIIAEATKIGVQVSSVTQLLLIVLLLGAGTDYGLFLVFRFKEELMHGADSKEAVRKALTRVGQSIIFSGLTVITALMCLLLAGFGFYKGLGPSLAIGVAITLLAGLTLLPSILSLIGKNVFWPLKINITQNIKIGVWGRVAGAVIKKPLLTIFVAFVIFGALIYGTKGWVTGGLVNGGPSATSDSAIASQIIKDHFPASIITPQALLFEYSSSQWLDIPNLVLAQSELAKAHSLKNIIGPIDLSNPKVSQAQITALYKLLGPPNNLPFTEPSNSKVPKAVYSQYRSLSQFISADGKTVQFLGLLSSGAPNSAEATASIPAARNDMSRIAQSIGATASGVYSQDSATYDIDHLSSADLVRIIPVVLAIIAILLAILLRSLIAPWYLVITVALTYLASLGFANIVFVHLAKNSPGINFVLPFLLFVFSMALGEDYNILVMSRIREESSAKVPIRTAIKKAIGITGTTVTSAGIILAGTFLVLGIVGGSSEVQQIGFSIAFGIMLDTFFVRTLLVPSIAVILGRWNWWPSKLYKQKS
ncbi:MAG: MMPL family transporter [Candidatus Saccharibacteria bacterium]